jgi:hypothetical protein
VSVASRGTTSGRDRTRSGAAVARRRTKLVPATGFRTGELGQVGRDGAFVRGEDRRRATHVVGAAGLPLGPLEHLGCAATFGGRGIGTVTGLPGSAPASGSLVTMRHGVHPSDGRRSPSTGHRSLTFGPSLGSRCARIRVTTTSWRGGGVRLHADASSAAASALASAGTRARARGASLDVCRRSHKRAHPAAPSTGRRGARGRARGDHCASGSATSTTSSPRTPMKIASPVRKFMR